MHMGFQTNLHLDAGQCVDVHVGLLCSPKMNVTSLLVPQVYTVLYHAMIRALMILLSIITCLSIGCVRLIPD